MHFDISSPDFINQIR